MAAMAARILVVAPDLPHPPFTGAHTRPLSVIRALARHHEVVVVGSAAPGADLAALEELCVAVGRLRAEPYRRGPVRSLLSAARQGLTPVPLIGRSSSPALARLVDSAVERFRPQVVQLETMYAVHYRRAGLPAVIDLPDVVSGLCHAAAAARPLRYALARPQGRAVARVERELLAAFAAILTINSADAARLRALGLEPTTVPLAVQVPDEAELGATGPAPLHVLFVANFEHLPNREAARFITGRLVPALRRRGEAARVTVAGRGARDVGLSEGVSRAETSGSALPGVRLEVVGDPPDLAPLYCTADAVIVPLAFGGGTKNKTLEAMSWSRPVVGSAQAFTGLPDELRGVAFVQTPLDADAMADALARLAADAALRERIGRTGRAYVLAEHTQARVDAAIDEVYERVLRTGARS
jgi:polysaccharide biosynthesis protein PslH